MDHRIGFVGWGFPLLVAASLSAQEVTVPVDAQLPLLLKVISSDRNLARSGPDYTVGVLFQPRFRPSVEFFEAVRRSSDRSPLPALGDRRIRLLPIEVSVDDLRKVLAEHPCDALYVGPLRALPIAAVHAAAQETETLTLSAVPQYVSQGLAVGVDLHADRLRILIHLPSAQAAGAAFSSRFLGLSAVEVVAR